MRFYAIQHAVNKQFIPSNYGRSGACNMDLDETRSRPPRVFRERDHAKKCLLWWLRTRPTMRRHMRIVTVNISVVATKE